jgi:transcriptional regulator with GAF, ATPase, and Fis domain
LVRQIKNSDELFTFAKVLSRQTDFDEILRLVAHKASQFLKADLALILMVNPDTRETVKTVIRDGKYSPNTEFRKIHIHVGGWILNYKKPFTSKNIHQDKRFTEGSFDGINTDAILGVPLIVEGIVIGALILLYDDSPGQINSQSTDFLENMATVSAPFLRNVQKIRQYFGPTMPESSLLQKYNNAGLVGRSERFVELLHAIEAATNCDVRVLLDGKTGTGKELIAKSIHRFSSRADCPFIAIDCGAIPVTLLESELFGHRRGAFTGAASDRAGLFIEAEGGTLFMDEINNLPYDLQAKLLRALQEGDIRPVGSDKPVRVNVRVISASSTPLKKLVEERKFREDLYYRLHVYPIYIPDLSERQADIPLLAHHFLSSYASEQKKNVQSFHEELVDFMKKRPWPGNIRELENFIERIVTITPPEATMIETTFLPSDIKSELTIFNQESEDQITSESIKDQLNKYEAQIIRNALIDCDWNQSQAARKLKTSESNIRYKITQLNIKKE